MKTRTNAIVIPYTKEGTILLQKRHSICKWGEEWSFWGGGIDAGETKEQAARRELKEELDFTITYLHYLGSVNQVMKHVKEQVLWHITYEVFITPISSDLRQFHVQEGDGLGLFSLEDARDLKMIPIDSMVLDLLEHHLRNNIHLSVQPIINQ